jgi:RNA polymerase sigma-70 factor (ECF subfamily)
MTRTPDHIFDEWLVLRAQDGEVEAMNELVRRWNRRLRAHARCLLGDEAAAADATQEAWYDIIRGIRKLADPAACRVWMYRIVSRRCADHQRRAAKRREWPRPTVASTDASSEPRDTQRGPDATTMESEELRRLGAALAQLPGDLRALIRLRYRENFPVAALAIALDCPGGTIKSRLHEARRQLFALLESNQ